MMDRGAGPDNVLLSEGGLVISQTRIVSLGDTYAMASISSCRRRHTTETNGTKKTLRFLACLGSLLVGAVALVAIGFDVGGLLIGAILAIGGLVGAFIFIKPGYIVHHVLTGTNHGEMTIVSTTDYEFAIRVERAINDAIIARG